MACDKAVTCDQQAGCSSSSHTAAGSSAPALPEWPMHPARAHARAAANLPKAQIHQLIQQRWKGKLLWGAQELELTEDYEHRGFRAMVSWQGAVAEINGEEVEIPELSFVGEARHKREAEHAAAQKALHWLQQEGYWEPSKPQDVGRPPVVRGGG